MGVVRNLAALDRARNWVQRHRQPPVCAATVRAVTHQAPRERRVSPWLSRDRRAVWLWGRRASCIGIFARGLRAASRVAA
eukprot:38659-Prymnesium_polylepis.1